MKIEYKPIAIQDECWGGSKKNPEVIVLVKMEGQGKKNKLYKNETMSFPDKNYLEKYIKENKLKVISEVDFKAKLVDKVLNLIRATR